ncbi:MAG: hypothetical protein QW590_00565 [Candidatus Bilamarchaeaceae archaeon]
MSHRILYIVLLFLLFGCYGLPTSEECERLTNAQERMECYRNAAKTAAYLGDVVSVRHICLNVIDEIGRNYGIEKQARVEKNLCLYECAKILAANENVDISESIDLCNEIETPTGATLFGAPVTEPVCREQVERLGRVRPSEYYRNDNNICANIVFILLLCLPLFMMSHRSDP